jgi:hypothetical protein
MGENGIVEVTADEQRNIADKLAMEISQRSSE